MGRKRAVENRRDRMELANEAGYSKVSFVSVLAGVLVAYGAFAILAAITGAVLSAVGVDVRAISDNDWRELGIGSGVAVVASLFLSYLFGGYVAGRMARRAGAANGLLVFVLGILVAAGVGAAVGSQADAEGILDNLRSIGVPTSGEEYSAIGTFAGIGSLLAMLLGSVFGGISGERWHGKLLARALDPTVGPSATAATSTDRDESPAERPVAVRGGGRHFAETGDSDRTLHDTDATREHDARHLDVGSSTDAGADPERTRTMR